MEHIPSIDDLRAAFPELDEVEFVASGGFKAVFKAQISGNIEAVKIALLPPATDDEAREQITARVAREIEVLSQCATPFLVKLGSLELITFSTGGHDYLAYTEEFLAGRSLIELIREGTAPSLESLIFLATCVFEALTEIASLNHIHRDIKPHNIIATELPKRPFVLLDLGIAFKVQGTELTAPGSGPPGTLLYMAPELFRPNYKDVLDIRSDIYSAGITIFEFAAGSHPLARTDENPYTTLYRILNQKPPQLKTKRADLPNWFCEMIDRCIKKTPALRFRDPEAFSKELEKHI